MLIEPNSHLYAYVVARDFGFAPNPFHGYCTLATCKPNIRKGSKINDWIIGLGGRNLNNSHKKCIFLMKVTEKIGFQDYWEDDRFSLKKSQRNGSKVQMLGDNIYHKDAQDNWIQEDSHHSNPDGTTLHENLDRDTGSTDQVLISECFWYFGHEAIDLDMESVGYKQGRNHKKIDLNSNINARNLIQHISEKYRYDKNFIIADPNQFNDSHKRVNQANNKIF